MKKIVGVKFNDGGRVYYFSHGEEEYFSGDKLIVETARGVECATVCLPEGEVEEGTLTSPLKPVLRKATNEDLEIIKKNESRRPDAMRIFTEKMEKYNLPMKLISCEFTFDGTKVIFYFSSDVRVDFRDFVKDLSSVFHLRIELRQIGIRDEIKILGGIGPCGRECCCYGCIGEVKKVSIKMAKSQGLSLNPTKISGYCGRLMCCLSYEDCYYSQVYKTMPRMGSEVETPDGKGIVINVDMLKMKVQVRIFMPDCVKYGQYDVSDIKFGKGAKSAPEGSDGKLTDDKPIDLSGDDFVDGQFDA